MRLLQEAESSIDAATVLIQNQHYNYAAARAYFAMFYCASAILEREGLRFSKHTGVISAFGKNFAKTSRVPPEFHRYLLQGIELRQRADYEMIQNLTQEQALEQVQRACRFLELAKTYNKI